MRKLLVLALVLGLVGVAAAYDLGNQAPVKSPQSYPENIPTPERQGGDTIALATLIGAIPYSDSGTTVGRVDDYDEVCPYSGATAADVVYKYVAGATVFVDIDLCYSSFDTKLYVYDAGLSLVACNDDFYFGTPCFVYSSKLENIPFNAGGTYYVVVDGYGNASGAYILDITPAAGPCVLTCPAGGYPEGEPPLAPNYVDNYNGGCNTPPGNPFQVLTLSQNILCGVSGWYLFNGSQYRDTDWFRLSTGPQGVIEITLDAELATYMFELGPQDCGAVGVVQQATGGPCLEAFMTIVGAANTPVWFWVGPTVFAPPPGGDSSYDYTVWFDYGVVATEATTWGTLKALYE